MNDSIGSELRSMSEGHLTDCITKTHNVNSDDSAVVIDSQPPQADVSAQPLGFEADVFAF